MLKLIIFKLGLWSLWSIIVLLCPLLSVQVFGLRSWYTTLFIAAPLIYVCSAYRKIATGGPEHLKLGIVLSVVGFAATSVYIVKHGLMRA